MTTIANSFAAKLTVAFVAIAMMISVASPAQAEETVADQIAALMAQITALQAEMGMTGDAMTSSASVCPYTWTRSLNMGDTGSDVMALQQFLNSDAATQVAVSGAGSAGNETEYYGPATGAAVAKFQEMYRAEILSPLNLVNSTTFFGNSTRAQANAVCVAGSTEEEGEEGEEAEEGEEGETETGSGSLGNDEGDIDSVTETAADETNIEEGQTAGIIAFEVEIDGDVEINRVDYYMEEVSGGGVSNDPDDYFVEASLWVDGDKVATVNVDDFNEDDYDVVTNDAVEEFRVRFSGLDLVFQDGDEPEFQVAFEVVSNLDSTDLAGASWDGAIEGIRFVDGEGFTDSDDTTITDSFGFDAEEVAELKISTSTNDPEAQVIEVSDSDDTDDIEIFVFEIEERNGVDVTIEDLRVTVTTGATSGETDEAVVVTEAKLFLGSDELDSQNVPTGGVVVFENIDLDIDADEEIELTVKLSFADADDYAAGTDVAVAIAATAVTDAEDANGNDEGDMTISGSATGETHELREEGIVASFVSVDFTKSVDCDGACASGEAEEGTAVFVFDVEAIGADAYIIDAVDVDGSYSAGAGTVVSVTGSSTALASMTVSGDADNGSTHFQIEEGETGRVTVTVYVTADTDPSALYAVALTGIEWNDTDDAVSPVNYTLDLGDFETESDLSLRHTN